MKLKPNQRPPVSARGWIGQFQVDFYFCGKSLCAKLATYILIKIKSFSCETFCMSTRSEANSNSEVEVKSAVHDRRIIPNIKFASTYLYTRVKRRSVRVKCHNTMYNVKCHNTMFPVRVQIETARNRKEIQKSNNRLFTQTAKQF